MDTDAVFLHHNPSGPSNLALPVQNPVRQHDLMAFLERLQFFLATAPNRWPSPDKISPAHHHPALNRFLLPTGEYVTCVLWNGVYYITGTDIVRALVFRFEAFGRPVRNMKKFEEGVFSDLRNLKPGHDACLEEPKSQFLDLLFKYQCIRTQKKQKVFYWFSVPHDRLFIDALDRDLKREKYGHESTTQPVAEPALSFSFDPKRPLFEQFNIKSMTALPSKPAPPTISLPELNYYNAHPSNAHSSLDSRSPISPSSEHGHPPNASGRSIFFNLLPFLEGAPNYKQRRKKAKARPTIGGLSPEQDGEKLYGRRSLDANLAGAPVVGRRSFEVGVAAARRSYDAPAPARHSIDEARSFTINHHPGQFGLAPLVLQSTPAAAHVCQLFTCAQVFATAEQLNNHMRTHETNSGSAERGNVDVDPQQRRETSEIPQFNLTTPDESGDYDGDGYEYEDDKAAVVYQNAAVVASSENPVAAPLKWGEEVTPTLDATQASHISPFAFNCNATPTTSVSGSSPALSLAQIQTHLPLSEHHHIPANGPAHPHPLSAPSHKLTFDVPSLPPSSNEDPRPRSADSRQHGVHARRPSTASAVPSATASSNSLGFNTSPSFATSSHAFRYQPYPVRRVTTPSGYSTPARSISTRDHSPSGMALDFSSSRVGKGHGQGEYIPPPTASSIEYNGSDYTCSQNSIASEGSPSAPFAHMLTLQETSPSLSHSSMELQYPSMASQDATSGASAQAYGSVQCADNTGAEYETSQSYDNTHQRGHHEAYNPGPNAHNEHHHHQVVAENVSHSVAMVESPTPYVAAPQPSYPMSGYGAYSSETSSAGMGMTDCQPSYLFASHYYEQPVA